MLEFLIGVVLINGQAHQVMLPPMEPEICQMQKEIAGQEMQDMVNKKGKIDARLYLECVPMDQLERYFPAI